MMLTVRQIGLGLLAAVIFMTGCDDQKKKNEQALLNEEVNTLRAQLDDQKKATDAAEQRARDEAAARAEAERRLQESMAKGGGAGNVGGGSGDGFDSIGGVEVRRGANMVQVTVSGDVLFDSGKATLKPAAKKTLDQVAKVLTSQYRGQQIMIEGHTDTDPIKKSKYASNYELGLARAKAVSDYLSQKGVPAGMIGVSSAGADEPRATKAASRRVEISVATE